MSRKTMSYTVSAALLGPMPAICFYVLFGGKVSLEQVFAALALGLCWCVIGMGGLYEF